MKKYLSLFLIASISLLITDSLIAQYCTPRTLTPSWGAITKVVTTGGSINISKTTASKYGYSNYSSTDSVESARGGSITMKVTHKGGLAIWVDWNDNGSFAQAGEEVFRSGNISRTATVTTTANITVPSGASYGSLRIRIGSGYYSSSYLVYCGGSYNTEFEDYRLSVPPPKARDAAVTSLNPSAMCAGLNDINVKVSNNGSQAISRITLKGTIGSTNFGPTAFTGLNIKSNKDTTLKLGTFTFVKGTSYNMKFYSYSPNGGTDQKTSNDTLTKAGYKAAIGGTYTIGASAGADFSTFKAAEAAMAADGICAATVFNVEAGTYNEQVKFGTYAGISATNNVRFRPDPSNTAPVRLTFSSSSSSDRGTVIFTSTQHIAIDSITIEAKGSSYANVIQFASAPKNLSFTGDSLLGNQTTSTTSNFVAIVYDYQTKAENITFRHNVMLGGSCSFYIYGTASNNQTGGYYKIEDNIMTGWNYMCIYMFYRQNNTINRNVISNSGRYNYPRAIYSYYCNNTSISGNNIQIKTTNYGYGIYQMRNYGTSSARQKVQNNMISITGGSGYHYGLYSNSLNYTDIDFNSISIEKGNAYPVYLYQGTSVNFRNNVMASGGTYYRYYQSGSQTRSNNVWWAPNATRSYGSLGSSLLNVDPKFKSKTDLHTESIALHNSGVAVSGVTKDIDGETRCPGTGCAGAASAPDRGADEYYLPNIDAAPKALVVPASCPGTVAIKVRVENKGLSNLTSFSVKWSIAVNAGSASIKSPVSWSGTLKPGKDTLITLGNQTMAKGSQYHVEAITYSPNATTDQKVSNDTIGGTFETAMNGTYTIGGLTPDFATIAAAATALNGGICGAVVFDIRPGTYTGQMKFTGSIAGASSTNTITWKGTNVSNTTISYLGSNGSYATVDLDRSNYMIFKNLKITNTYTGAYSACIRLRNNTNHITIDSCELSTSASGTSYGLLGSSAYVGTTNSLNSNITVTNSTISDVGEGIRLGGTSSIVRSKNIKIENNTFKDIGYTGIYIYNYFDSVTVKNNDLSDFGGSTYGAYFYYVRNLTMEGNEIVASGNTALYLNRMNYTGATSSSVCRVANNMISQTGGAYAVYSYYGINLDFYNNSVRSATGYALRDYYSRTADYRNNIFYSETNYAFYINNTSSTYISAMNNNLYYRGNSSSIVYDAGARTLASWKSYRSSLNSNSKVGDPKFKAKDDLHIANGKLADSLALTGLGVTLDIDGTTRSTTNPDAGADEYDYSPLDAHLAVLSRPTGICLTATDTLEFGVVNTGGDTIKLGTNGVSISWTVSGPNSASGTDAANSGSLAPGDTVFIKTANSVINLSKAGTYTVNAFITSAWDKYNENDTLVVSIERLATDYLLAIKDTTVYYKDSLDVTIEAGVKSEMLITEVCYQRTATGGPSPYPSYLNTDDFTEITTSKGGVSLAGYSYEMWVSGALRGKLTFPAGAKTSPNGTVVIGTSTTSGTNASSFYYSMNTSWSMGATSVSGNIIRDPMGDIVDVITYGRFTFPAAAGVTSSDWTGSTTVGNAGIKRVNGPDNNTSSNWVRVTNSNRQTPNVKNPGLKIGEMKLNNFKWTYAGSFLDSLKTTQAGPWSAKGNKDYIASFVSQCTADTIKDTANIVAFIKNLVLTGNTPEYYSYPVSQSNGIGFSGTITNLGDSMTTIRAFAQLGGAAVGDSLASTALARFGSANYTINNGAAVTTTGNKAIKYYYVAATGDDFPSDDSASTMVNVTDTIMARENGGLGISVASSAFNSFGQRFTVYTQDSVTEGQVYISAAFPGDKFKFELYALNGNTVGALLNESADYTITSTSDTGWKSIRLNCLSVLGAGDYMLSIKKTSSLFNSGLGANQINAKANTGFANNGSWTTLGLGGKPFNFGIRMVFGSYDYPTLTVAPVCVSGNKFSLSGGLPTGGSYFGTGVSGDSLNPSVLGSGVKTLSYTLANSLGCRDTISATIDIKAEPTVVSTFAQLTSCVVNNASISVSASNGFGTFSYSNNGGTSYQTSNSFAALGSGSYTVMVKDSVCTVTDTTFIATPPGAPSKPTATGGSVYCKGATIGNLSVSNAGSGGTFKWYTNGALTQAKGTGRSITAFDSTATITYYVVEDKAGCISPSDTTVVTVNPLPKVSYTSISNRCTNVDSLVLATGTPTGGKYSGPGVYNGVFYADSAGAGTHLIKYTFTDAKSCTNLDSASVIIYQAPLVALAALDSHCTNTPKYNLSGGLPTGGTYSGFGVSSGQFDANVSGQGFHTVQYKVTNTNCADSASRGVRIHTSPTAAVTTLAARCLNAGTLTLSNGTPLGGIYKGTGVSAGVFNPLTATSGSHSINYVYTDNNQCKDSASTNIQVDSLPVITYLANAKICTNTPQFRLSQASASPSGGTYKYFGTGVVSNIDFDANLSGKGTHSVGYTYVDANGCTDTSYQNQLVDTFTSTTWANLNGVCLNANPVSLSGGTPNGGVYAGNGTQTGGIFRPDSAGVGSHKLSYVFTNGLGCKDSTSQTQVVWVLPVVNVTMPANWCLNATPIKLSSGTPMGGVYTVNGVADTMYSTVVSKLDTVIYAFTDTNACTNSDMAVLQADTVPVVTFASIASSCIGYAQFNLTQGMPVGGVYSGNHVILGRVYQPVMTAVDTLNYTFVDSNKCSDSAVSIITVNSLPVMGITKQADICENTPTFAMSGGTPTGGTYAGGGVSTGNYTASTFGTGTDNITYTFTDANNCTDSIIAPLVVNNVTKAGMQWLGYTCDNSTETNLVPSGLPRGGTFSGVGVTANEFDPNAAGGEGIYTLNYVFINPNNCQDSITGDIIVEASPVFNIVGDTIGCGKPGVLMSTNLPGKTYKWSTGERTDTARIHKDGLIWVKVSDAATQELCSNYDTVNVSYDAVCLGFDEQLAGTSVRYFPNPNNGSFYYELQGFDGLNIDVSIQAMSGQVVYQKTWNNVSRLHTGQINMEVIESGVYFINLKTEKGSVMHRITINR